MTVDALALHGEETIKAGSQSFAAAARLFDPAVRRGATALYAWCRHCDDVVDGQHLGHGRIGAGHGAHARLADLERRTRQAVEDGAAADPAFASLAYVARRHAIPVRHPLQLIAGFRMDVEGRRYRTLADTVDYAYHVAGVVGVMMAMVMGRREPAVLDRAADLGIAFQLTNIARDVVEDAAAGRVYLPADWLAEAGVPVGAVAAPAHRAAVAGVVRRLVGEADRYYASAEEGIRALPLRSAAAVSAARKVYGAIGREVVRRGASAWDDRVATSPLAKAGLVMAGTMTAATSRLGPVRPRDPTLYRRPP